jgi:hypothetical protein
VLKAIYPLVLVRPERAGGRAAGVSLELIPLAPTLLAPTLVLRTDPPREILLAHFITAPGNEHFSGLIHQDEMHAGRLALECVVPDPLRGDLTVVTDVVLAELAAGREAEIASFDGSLLVRVSAGTLASAIVCCVASTAGPPLVARDGTSIGRVHAILPSGDTNPFKRPVRLVLRFTNEIPTARVEARRYDRDAGEFVSIATTAAGEVLAELSEPGVVALFEK